MPLVFVDNATPLHLTPYRRGSMMREVAAVSSERNRGQKTLFTPQQENKMTIPSQVQQVLDAIDKNAAEAGCDNDMYAEEDAGIWIIACNYESINLMLAYDPSSGKWYYQRMYGCFYGEGLESIGGRVSKPMKGGLREALAGAACIYTG